MDSLFKKTFLKTLARKEKVEAAWLGKNIENGRVVVPLNRTKDRAAPCAIGRGLKVKINTNIGTSSEKVKLSDELKKLDVATAYGSDTVMDLSTGPDLRKALKAISSHSSIPLGTVPIYQAAQEAEKRYGTLDKLTHRDIFEALRYQAEQGVDFFTIHAGILKKFIGIMKKEKRTGGIVSRGGAILTRWMYVNKKENPLYEYFDEILEICRDYRIAISLGDALRPGAIADSTDQLQINELRVLSQLVKKCRKKGVQVMVEGPGHIRLDEIQYNMTVQKQLCKQAPFYVLGPLPTDIFFGYDHIVSAIGGAIAAHSGADFLCVVTPAEHLRHPDADDIKLGVIASKIAAHCVDVLRFPDEWERDRKLSLARAHRRWEEVFSYAIDRPKAEKYREAKKISSEDICSMCGKFCSLKLIDKCHLLK